MDPASSIAASLGVILGRGFRNGLYRELTAGVADGLTEATYPVLSVLERERQPVSAATLAPMLGLDRSVISRRAATLIQAGLVINLVGPSDRRQTLLGLTPAGYEAIRTTRARLDVAIHRHLDSWAEPDRTQFAALLRRFTASPLSP